VKVSLTMPLGNHVFCTCQPGAAAALKADVGRNFKRFKPAYMRPGLVTFKVDGAPVGANLPAPSLLARCWGLGLGQARDGGAVLAAVDAAVGGKVPLVLQVSPRVLPTAAEPPPPNTPDTTAVFNALLRESPALALRVRPDGVPQRGDLVVDVLCASGEPHFVGMHVFDPAVRVPGAGGAIPVTLPAHLPSRAYVKMVEALAFGRVPLAVGDTALELGSAPGGATLALLERGVAVLGVDPGAMDPQVVAYVGEGGARLTHLQRLMSQVDRRDLPAALHWVVLDANMAPQVALGTVARLLSVPRPALCGVILTLKLDGFAAVHHAPGWLERVEGMGMARVRATHLPSSRTEVCVVGLTPAGLARLTGDGK